MRRRISARGVFLRICVLWLVDASACSEPDSAAQGSFAMAMPVDPAAVTLQQLADDSLPVTRAAAIYYVSPTGSGLDCSVTAPCALATAQAIVRAATATMTGDLVVRLLAGTYRLGQTLLLEAAAGDGGQNGFRVVYEANAGAQPVLSGGVAITGWSQVPGSPAWVAAVPPGFVTHQLYIDGVRALRARGPIPGSFSFLPDVGYLTSDTTLANWTHPQDVRLVYDHAWVRSSCSIARVEGAILVMNESCLGNSTRRLLGSNVGPPAFLENALELLDEPGEWYLDSTQHLLWYIPRASEDLTTAHVEAAGLERLVRAVGTPQLPLHDVTLRGLTFAYAGWTGLDTSDGFSDIQANHRFVGRDAYKTQGMCDAVVPAGTCPYGDWTPTPAHLVFAGTDGVVLERNVFTHLGGVGVRFEQSVENTKIVGNVFRDIGGTGLAVGLVSDLGWSDPDKLPDHTVVTNNWFTDIASELRGGVAIFQGYTRFSLIQHNQINEIPYTGISSGWGWGYHASRTQGNVIRANLVFDHLLTLQDGGGIYTLGDQGPGLQDGAVIAYNFVHGQRHHGSSIYSDGGSRYMSIHHNVQFDNAVPSDQGGCHQGGTTVMGDLVVSNNWWQHGAPNWDCVGPAPKTFVVTDNRLITSLLQAPAVITDTAGLEPRYEDIRPGPAPATTRDLAYRKPVQLWTQALSPASMQLGSEPGAAVDGDRTTVARASASGAVFEVDLLGIQDIDLLVIDTPDAFDTAIHIESSSDGRSYQSVAYPSALHAGPNTIALPAIAARYLRVVTDAEPAGPLGIAELAVYGRPDVALHKPVFSESSDGTPAPMQPFSLPSFAVDGMTSTSAQAGPPGLWRLRVDLGAVHRVERAIIGMSDVGAPYHVESSLDGLVWSLLAVVSDGASVLPLPATPMRHLRIVSEPSADARVDMAVSRISLYAQPNLARAATTSLTAESVDGHSVAITAADGVSAVVDGNLRTWLQSPNHQPYRLRVDFGTPQTIRQVDIIMPASGAAPFQVSASYDARTWHLLANVAEVSVGGFIHVPLADPALARYIAITVDGSAAIAELAVY